MPLVMVHPGSFWFVTGMLTGCILIAVARVPSEGMLLDAGVTAGLAEQLAAYREVEQARRVNRQIHAGPAHSPEWSFPKFDRFPSRFPLSGTADIGSGFGWRPHPMTGVPNLHEGIDFNAPAGMPILAAASGKVVKAGWHGGYGLMVEIAHSASLITRYAHAQAIHVRTGDWVGQGQMIAEVGSTGHSTGPHLHFEVRLQGQPLDPKMFMRQDAQLSLR